MPAYIDFGVSDRGNTVPYPPLVDDIRRNHGYVDLRGQPSAVDLVVEAQESTALRGLLLELARPGSTVISLGCDLGDYDEKTRRLSSRYIAGGYVQLADGRLTDCQSDFLKNLAEHLAQSLRVEAGGDRWKVKFELSAVA